MRNVSRFILLVVFVFVSFCPSLSIDGSDGSATTFILVRHAEKARDGGSDPPLTEEGKARAKDLASMLHFVPLEAVFSTPYIRTRETARPTAESKNLSIRSYSPGKDREFLSGLLKKYAGETVLIVGHSNTIPGMVNILLQSEEVPDLDDSTYDNLFIVTVFPGGNAKALRLRFGVFSPIE